MQPLELGTSPAGLSETQREALISLLTDDDPAIHQMVRSRLLSYGQAARDWLRPHTLSDNPVLRRRAREIIGHQNREAADGQFLDFCRRHGEDFDLEEATGLLAHTRYPDLNLDAYTALYDLWAEQLRERLVPGQSARETLAILNRFLFEELGFTGYEQYNDDVDCCYLNRVVDRRRGNPIGLCAIYLFVTRRLQLPVTGIGLPGHFICRYQSSTEEIYLDCFRKGAFLTKRDCYSFLLRSHFDLSDRLLSPVSTRLMLLRMCNNLHQTYAQLEMREESQRVRRYVMALTR
jgi:regulator of sirC expression with transglutaminase-like and TPR domain